MKEVCSGRIPLFHFRRESEAKRIIITRDGQSFFKQNKKWCSEFASELLFYTKKETGRIQFP